MQRDVVRAGIQTRANKRPGATSVETSLRRPLWTNPFCHGCARFLSLELFFHVPLNEIVPSPLSLMTVSSIQTAQLGVCNMRRLDGAFAVHGRHMGATWAASGQHVGGA